jgi:hypothetical protein
MDPASYKIDPDEPTWTGIIPPAPTTADHPYVIHGWEYARIGTDPGGLHDGHVVEHLLGTPLPMPHWHVELPERKPVSVTAP